MISTTPRNKQNLSARRAVEVSARTTLDGLLLGNGDDVDWDCVELEGIMSAVRDRAMADGTYTKALEQILCIRINLKS